MRVIEDRDLIKNNAVDHQGNKFLPKRVDGSFMDPEERQAIALQNIADMLKKGLANKTDQKELVLRIGQAIMSIINETNNNMMAMIVEIGKNIKVNVPQKPISAKLTAHISNRDRFGRMQDFEADVKYIY